MATQIIKNHLRYILYIADFLGAKGITSGSISNILTQ